MEFSGSLKMSFKMKLLSRDAMTDGSRRSVVQGPSKDTPLKNLVYLRHGYLPRDDAPGVVARATLTYAKSMIGCGRAIDGGGPQPFRLVA
jgi:hypothetical protein